MPVFDVDSSAFLKRYRNEPGTTVVNQLFDWKTATDDLVTSQLIFVEVEAALARAVKAGLLSVRAQGAILRAFANDLQNAVVLPISPSLLSESGGVAHQYALRALDALHFATLLRVTQASANVVLVASDLELLAAGNAAGLTVLNPATPGAQEQLRKLRP